MTRKISWLLILAGLPLAAAGATERGYQPRDCGFDLDDDGIVGEPADCNLCDGFITDPDSDGVDEDLIYVSCGDGIDAAGCGAPGNPCGSLAYAFNTVADGNGDGAEDIVCFRGICSPDELKPKVGGVAGFVTKPRSGSEARDWQLPSNPAMLVGWDQDNDGRYPPEDADDVAVLDGDGLGFAFKLNHDGRDNSYFEMAHFEVRDYGRGAGIHDEGGLIKPDGIDGNAESSHIYLHDLSLRNINKDKEACSRCSVVNFFHSDGLSYFAMVNIEALDTGGYFGRGSGPGTPSAPEAGPWRFQNLTATFHGCDFSGPDSCTPAFANVSGWKIWGYISQIEILDSELDSQAGAWEPNPGPGGPPGANAVVVAQCARDVTIRNNRFLDFNQGLVVQGNATGFCDDGDARTVDDVVFDRNEVRNSYAPWAVLRLIHLSGGGGTNDETSEDIEITNNFLSSTSGFNHCIKYDTGNQGGPQPGTVTIVNNTCHGTSWGFGSLYVTDRAAFRHQDFVVRNNVFSGIDAGKTAVQTRYAPSAWNADFNVFDPDAFFVWNANNNPKTGLSTFAASSGGDGSSKACAPAYMNAPAGDFHLRLADTCARDAAAPLPAVITKDFDADPRLGPTWDAGADETEPPLFYDGFEGGNTSAWSQNGT